MKQLFKTSLGFSVVLSSLATTVTAQTLEEVVVTAQKREQAITDVSIAMNAFTAEDMRSFRVEDATDIAQLLSNIDIKGTLGGVNPAITVRGVGLNDFNANNNPSVGVYIDEVFLASPAMLDARMFDVARVEVLKGPQGTLYGRNATGGAINIINRRPTQEFEGYISGSYGDYDMVDVQGAVSGGLSANTAGRLAISYKNQGESFHDNRLTGTDFGDLESLSGRATLSFEASDTFRGDLSIHFGNVEGTNTPFSIYGLLDPSNPAELCAPAANYQFDNAQCSDVFGIQETADGDPYTHTFNPDEAAKYILDTDYTGGVLRLEWDLGDWDLVSITGYESQDRVFGDNINSHPLQLSSITHDEDISQFSQELRLSGGSDSGPQWIVGAFYSQDEFESENIFEAGDFFVTNLFWNVDQETTTWAFFGSVDIPLSERMTLTAGLRYTDEEIDFAGGTTDLNPYDASCILDPFCGPTGLGAFQLTGTDSTFSDDNLSGRVALEFRPKDDWLLYGSVSTAFKSGGFFGDFTFDNSELVPFDSETITAYEIGSKSTLASGRVQLNASAFFYDYKDMQTLVPGVLVTAFTNADDAEIYGLDIDLLAVPTEGLTIGLGLGLLDTELGAIGVVPAGNQSPNAAEVQANGLIRYEFAVGSNLQMGIQANFKYTDDMYRDAFNDPYNLSDSYSTVDARVWISDAAGNWEAAVWAKNLTDEEYTEQAFNFVGLSGLANQLYGPPQVIGASLSYFFGN
jgi:iron complex outermembrane receptor protein|tara:strand:+ start:667 stop:2898 length:2232 start_codon:yes stop_codon:yes gene_type:complete